MKHLSLLSVGAWLNIALAVSHILCMPWLDAASRLYGIDGLMNQIASHGCYWPYVFTLVIAVCFVLCGIYALSADGLIHKLPLLRLGIFTIAVIFLFRAGIGCYSMFDKKQYSITDLSSVSISGGIGVLYLLGGIKKL